MSVKDKFNKLAKDFDDPNSYYFINDVRNTNEINQLKNEIINKMDDSGIKITVMSMFWVLFQNNNVIANYRPTYVKCEGRYRISLKKINYY